MHFLWSLSLITVVFFFLQIALFAYLNNFVNRNNPDSILEIHHFSFLLTVKPSVERKGHHVLGGTSYLINGSVFISVLLFCRERDLLIRLNASLS